MLYVNCIDTTLLQYIFFLLSAAIVDSLIVTGFEGLSALHRVKVLSLHMLLSHLVLHMYLSGDPRVSSS